MKTVRALLADLGTRAKKKGFLDRLCRYNPFFYDSVRALLEQVDRMDYAERLGLSARLLKPTFEWTVSSVARMWRIRM